MTLDSEKVKILIRENLKAIHTVEDVAKRLKCSPETLRKEFWRKERRTLGEYIMQAKLETAKKMLVETDLPCKEICFEVGFGREDSGAKTFKRRVGMTMEAYRALVRNGTMPERCRWSQSRHIPEQSTILGNRNEQPKKSTRNGNQNSLPKKATVKGNRNWQANCVAFLT